MARSALSAFRAKEDEIEKRKMEVRERVKTQLGRVEEETRRLANIREVCLILVIFFSFQKQSNDPLFPTLSLVDTLFYLVN